MWMKRYSILTIFFNVDYEAHEADLEILQLPWILCGYLDVWHLSQDGWSLKTLQHEASPEYVVWVKSSTVLLVAIEQSLEWHRMKSLHKEQMSSNWCRKLTNTLFPSWLAITTSNISMLLLLYSFSFSCFLNVASSIPIQSGGTINFRYIFIYIITILKSSQPGTALYSIIS